MSADSEDEQSQACVVNDSCVPLSVADDVQVEAPAAADALEVPTVDVAPQQSPSETRTIGPAAVVESPFAAPVTQAAPVEAIGPMVLPPSEKLPPGPPARR